MGTGMRFPFERTGSVFLPATASESGGGPPHSMTLRDCRAGGTGESWGDVNSERVFIIRFCFQSNTVGKIVMLAANTK
jgi:hypothetical protein